MKNDETAVRNHSGWINEHAQTSSVDHEMTTDNDSHFAAITMSKPSDVDRCDDNEKHGDDAKTSG